MRPDDWTVWGDAPEPVLEDTEMNCKAYVESRPNNLTLYISDPNGNEYEFCSGTWRKT